LLTLLEPTTVGGFKERRVLFQDGLEVDFSILPSTIAKAPPAEADAVQRGHAPPRRTPAQLKIAVSPCSAYSPSGPIGHSITVT
jgi:hypothetical protein